jgi:T5SS/PEP-CTERM-associated repeat protein
VPGNWSPSGPPNSGDTGIVNSGTLQLTDAQFNSNQLVLNAGTFQISNDTGSVSASSFDLNTTLLAGASGAAEFDIFGPFVNDGTIAAVDHVVTVAIGAYTNGTSSAGTLINDGLIAVVSGGTLDVTQPSAGTFQGGNVVINDGSALIAASDFNSNFTLDNQAALELNSITESATVDFNGTADLLKADAGAYDSVYTVTGFASGDTLDIGPGAVGTIIYDYPSSGLGGGPSQPTLTVVGTTGATLFSEAFTGPNGNTIGGNTGTFVAGTLTSGVEAAGQFELVTAGNGDTLVELLPPSTWSWIGPANGGTLNSPSNWQLVGGPGNQRNAPNSGDTAFGNNVTLSFGTDSGLSGNTIFVTGTSALDFIGDNGTTVVSNGLTNVIQPGINISNPTIDGSSAISNDSSAAATTLNFAGNAVNQGFIISNASGIGNTMTLNVKQNGTAPGYFINDGEIEATAGNALTIAIAGTSELFNANLIYANGGSILITAGNVGTTAAIAGGYAPMAGGVALIAGGGTIEVNAGFPSGTGGSTPAYGFADGTSGDTLKIDQLSQFSGRILGFETGDTIDLGGSLAIGTISVKSDGRVLLENSGGTAIDTLVLSTGSYATGNFATTLVAAGTHVAGGFTLTTGTDGDTLLTTNVVNDFYTNVSGTWATAANWSSGVPGASSTPIVGDGAQSPFVLTTGTGTSQLDSLTEVSGNSTIQVTNNVTVGTTSNQYGIQQLGGEIEVTGGNMLSTPTFRQVVGGSVLQVDAGGVLSITGHDNVGLVNNGTISQNAVVSGTTFSVGNTVGVFIAGTATVNGGEINAGPGTVGANAVTGGFIDIGVGDTGSPATMTVQNGGTVIDTYAQLGSDPTSFGALTLTGSGTTWDDVGDSTDAYNTRGYMFVGTDTQSGNQPSPSPSGTAQLLVENGATLNEATWVQIANSADSAGSATIASGGVWNIGTSGASFLNVGNSGSGTLVVSGGTVNVAAGTGTLVTNGVTSTGNSGFTIGHRVGSNGTVVVDNSGTLTVTGTGGVAIGQLSQGLLQVLESGTMVVAGSGISVGSSLGGVGTVVVGGLAGLVGGPPGIGGSDGVSALLRTTAGGITVGNAGVGTLYVESGGTVALTGGGITVGSSASASGYLELDGGLLSSAANGLTVGSGGAGTLDLNSGTISVGSGVNVGNAQIVTTSTTSTSNGTVFSTVVATVASGVGTAVLNGGQINATNGLSVGIGDAGTLQINSGTVAVAGGGQIGSFSTASTVVTGRVGTVVVSTATLATATVAGSGTVIVDNGLLSLGSSLLVGPSANGVLDVGAGGTVAISSSNLNVGFNAGGSGTVEVSGTGALITAVGTFGGLSIGQSGFGSLDIANNGVVNTGTNAISLGTQSGGRGTISVESGGTLLGGFLNIASTFTGIASGLLTVGSGGVVDATGVTESGGGTIIVGGGGSPGVLSNGGQITVGQSGTGALLAINSGGAVIDTNASSLQIASFNTATSGTVTVNGGTLTGLGGIEVGGSGVGMLTVGNGGQVVINGGTAQGSGIGNAFGFGGGSGVVVINNGTVSETGSGFTIGGTNSSGSLAIGTLGLLTTSNQFNGSFSADAGDIGASGSGTAAVTVNGGTWIANGQLSVGGNAGTGSLDISGGGLVNTGSFGVTIGDGSVGNGNVTVDSGGTLSAADILVGNTGIGGSSTGTLTVDSGGIVSVGSISVGSLNPTSVIDLSGGTLQASSSVSVNSNGAVQGFGTLLAGVGLAGGPITASGGLLEITGGIAGGGTLNLGSGSTLLLDAAPGATPTISFATGVPETLLLASPSIAGGANTFAAITGVAVGDEIALGGGIAINQISYATGGNGQDVTLDVTENATNGTITLDNVQFAGAATSFVITTDGANGDAAIQAAPCFAAGTRIATTRGEVAVEDLAVGDLLPTVLGEDAAPVVWIGRREVACARHPDHRKVWPVRVAAGAFGAGRPYAELWLSPDHAVYVGEVLIPVRFLVNGTTIAQVAVERVTYYHVELPRHDVVLAQGLEVETYLDVKDRSDFANGAGPVRLYPDFSTRMWEAFGCAPLVVTGAELDKARACVAAQEAVGGRVIKDQAPRIVART